jgi:hypothetical protein
MILSAAVAIAGVVELIERRFSASLHQVSISTTCPAATDRLGDY